VTCAAAIPGRSGGMGLAQRLRAARSARREVQKCARAVRAQPDAIAIAKAPSFNMDTAHQSGIAGMGSTRSSLLLDTDESREGVRP